MLRFWKWNVPWWMWPFLLPGVLVILVLLPLALWFQALIDPTPNLAKCVAVALLIVVVLFVAGEMLWGTVALVASLAAGLGWWWARAVRLGPDS